MLKIIFTLLPGVVIATPIMLGIGFVWGVKHQKSVVAAQVATQQITILKKGREVDEKVFDADDATLCDLLGGC
jgi:hypothetical protein